VELTEEQRAAVEAGPGPVIVLAGAGTGKTTVIVERARWLLERFGEGGPRDGEPTMGGVRAADGSVGPLLPENILVLTYNVRATDELVARFERRLGTDVAGRIRIQNFHAFGYAIMTEAAADAGYGERPRVLDDVGQRLLLRDLRPTLDLVYYRGGADPYHALGDFAAFINRARDELVTPDDFDHHVDAREAEFAARFGPLGAAVESIVARGDLARLKEVRRALAGGNGETEAHREARRAYFGDGLARWRSDVPAEARLAVEAEAERFLRDATAFEILRLRELGLVYRAYLEALAARKSFDFGEQIGRAIAVLEALPNIRRRYQQRFRHVLVDEFQDANIAQIRLLELVGLAPDRPANVLVVGDDDQSIYRFRGASYAAFRQFQESFEAVARRAGHAEGVPTLSLTVNRRSSPQVLLVAGRLIAHNETRFAPDKGLRPDRPDGRPVELGICRDDGDEADLVLERLQRAWAEDARPGKRWRDYAVLYRKHRARQQIVERLRRAEIPHVVAGGTGLWAHPEIRDIEAALRVLAEPDDDVSLVRLMSAGPWRFGASEIVRLTRMAYARGEDLLSTAREVLHRGELEVEVREPPAGDEDGHRERPGTMRSWLELVDAGSASGAAEPPPAAMTGGRGGRGERQAREERLRRRSEALDAALRARLTRLLEVIDTLTPSVHRDGPFTVLDEYLQRTSRLYDLLAVGTSEAQRDVLAVARLLRFAARWQRDQPEGTLAAFLHYLDVYQEVGGEPEGEAGTGLELDGVRLMTIHQAKGLEFHAVFVPQLVERMMPDLQGEQAILPVELLRQRAPEDFSLQEERRLAYVAMTRARDLLVLTTVEGGGARPSRFVGEVSEDHGPELAIDESRVAELRWGAEAGTPGPAATEEAALGAGPEEPAPPADATAELVRRLPLPTAQERRFALRRRAVELIGALEAVDPAEPFAAAERSRLADELVTVAREASREADEARMRGLHPLTLRVVAADSPSGARLLELAPLPDGFSYSSFRTYRECPFRFALERIYRIPVRETKPYFTFGTIAHEVFQRFVEERRAAHASGEAEPGMERLRELFAVSWTPEQFADPVVAESYRTRGAPMLEAFYGRELEREAEVIATEYWFDLPLDPGDGSAPVVVSGAIDRVDRLADGSVEIVDYKTGRPRGQAEVDADEQLTIYALAARDVIVDPATGRRLGRPARLALYFTEADARVSTTRSDEQLDACRGELLALARRIRGGDFAATPGPDVCRRCDYRPICPSRHEDGVRP